MLNNSTLHHAIIKGIIEDGYAPGVAQLSEAFGKNKDEIEKALYALQDDHGVVLHPHKAAIWVIHPFSLAPTPFVVKSQRGKWWGNCAWCSLGVAALLGEDVEITTTIGAEGKQVTIQIIDGEVIQKDLLIHFPIPMKNAWDNVIYTCSNMLIFEDEDQVYNWCDRHQIANGDIQTVDHIWQFSKVWYGNHLSPQWKKWTVNESKEIFAQFKLNHATWDLGESKERF